MSTGISEPRRRRWLRLRLWLWLSAHYNLSFPSRLDATVESSRVVGRVYRYHSDSKFRRGVVFLNIRLSFPTRLLKYFNSDVVDRHRSFETFRPLGRRVLHRIAFRTGGPLGRGCSTCRDTILFANRPEKDCLGRSHRGLGSLSSA